MKFQVYYMKPDWFRDGCMGVEWLSERNKLPDPKNLGASHVLLTDVTATDLEDLFCLMQGEHWSPNGEAMDMIKSKGLEHTSMSVGDIAVDASGAVHICDQFGWIELPRSVSVTA